jgi:hypothetical protein
MPQGVFRGLTNMSTSTKPRRACGFQLQYVFSEWWWCSLSDSFHHFFGKYSRTFVKLEIVRPEGGKHL